MRFIMISAALLVLALVSVRAQGTLSEAAQGRYTFKDVPEGVLRLETGSGQVSLCGRRHMAWTCEAVPDDRAALEAEIGRLEGENGRLKRELLAHGLPLPDGGKGDARVDKPGAEGPAQPSDADVDRVMAFNNKVWHRLMDMVQEMQRDSEHSDDAGRKDIRAKDADHRGRERPDRG